MRFAEVNAVRAALVAKGWLRETTARGRQVTGMTAEGRAHLDAGAGTPEERQVLQMFADIADGRVAAGSIAGQLARAGFATVVAEEGMLLVRLTPAGRRWVQAILADGPAMDREDAAVLRALLQGDG